MTLKQGAILWWSRSFRVIPLLAREQTGVAIVTILFAFVISQLALKFAEQIVAIVSGTPLNLPVRDGDATIVPSLSMIDTIDERDTIILHLGLAIILTITSAIGYYTSVNLPKLRVRFFNKAFLQFILDVSMVFTYFLVVEFAENSSTDQSARPESFLVFFSFLLYLLWDIASYRISTDTLAQLAMGHVPREDNTYGYRRWITVAFTILTFFIWFVTFISDVGVRSDSSVITFDVLLIALIIAYRICKSLGDEKIRYRSMTSKTLPSNGVETPQTVILSNEDIKNALPKEVYLNLSFLKHIHYKCRNEYYVKSGSNAHLYAVLNALVSANVLTPIVDVDEEVSLSDDVEVSLKFTLTEFGKYIAAAEYH